MAIIYNWDCNTVDVRPLEDGETDVVYNVHWILTGTKEVEIPPVGPPIDPPIPASIKKYTVSNIGTEIVTVDPSEPFIPFADLTNDIVVDWTKAAMGEEQVLSLETSIANQIALLINPVSITMQLPTVPPTPPPAPQPEPEPPVED